MSGLLFEGATVPTAVPLLSSDHSKRIVVLDSTPTREELTGVLAANGTTIEVYTPNIMQGFYQFVPMLWDELAGNMPETLREPLTCGLVQDRRLGLETLLQTKSATIDSGIFSAERRNAGSVRSKLKWLNRLYREGHDLGLFPEREYPLVPEGFMSPDRFAYALGWARDQYIDLIGLLPWENGSTPGHNLAASDAPFVPWLRARLGENLTGVNIHGSSVYDPEHASDWDIHAFVQDMAAARYALEDVDPYVFGDTVVSGEREGAKRLSVMTIPDDARGIQFLRYTFDAQHFSEKTRAVYGIIPTVSICESERVLRQKSHMYVQIASSIGTLANAIAGSRELSEGTLGYATKNATLVARSLLGIAGTPIDRNPDILRFLVKEGISVPPPVHECMDGKEVNGERATSALLDTAMSFYQLHDMFVAR